MQSESARMASAAEARFRIDAPNSLPRSVKVIALDHPSERLVKQLAQRQWGRATFFTASAFGGAPKAGESFAGWLSDLAGRTKNLVEEVDAQLPPPGDQRLELGGGRAQDDGLHAAQGTGPPSHHSKTITWRATSPRFMAA